MVSPVLFKSSQADWKTPKYVFKCLERLFGRFDLDPCTEDNNLGTPYYYTLEDDGLCQPWFGNVYVNPPYGKDVGRWVEKAVNEVRSGNAQQVVMLLAARTDTKWFQRYVLGFATEVLFVEGRIKFDGAKNPAPFPSVVVVFRGGELGKVKVDGINFKKCFVR